MKANDLDGYSHRHSPPEEKGQSDWFRVAAVSVMMLVFYMAVGFALRVPVTQAKVPVGGDEHHYLTQAVSTLEDGDVVVIDNYQQGDYLAFYDAPLDSGFWNLIGAKGFSGHSPGAGVIVAPGLLLLGWVGVLITLAFSMAGAFYLTAKALRRCLARPLFGAELALLAAGFASLPLLAYSHTLYPESFMAPLVAALFLLGVVHSLASSRRSATVAAVGAITLCGLSIGLHPKYAVLLAGVTMYFVAIEIYEGVRGSLSATAIRSLLYVSTAGVWGLAFSALHLAMWDAFSPTGWWTTVTDDKGVEPVRAVVQFLDIFLGRSLGLFILVPLSVLAVGFVGRAVRRGSTAIESRLALLLVVAIVAVAGPAAYSSDWHAGDSPLGRYASPLVPALLLTGVLYVTNAPRRRGQVVFASVLSMLGLLGMALYSASPTSFRTEPFGTGGSIDLLADAFPMFIGLRNAMWTAAESTPWLFSAVVFGILVAVALWLFRSSQKGSTQAIANSTTDSDGTEG